ncbi:Kinesin-like protein KIN-13A [Sarracenia purpurea var. burkii]
MGGQVQQSNAAATALYDHPGGGSLHNAGPGNDAGDAVMARWLQSAGLQHLASPLASNGIDHRLLPNLLMQGYGAQSAEEKQRLFKLMRNLNFNGESGSEPYTPTAQSSGGLGASDGFFSPEFRGDFGAGLLDLHAMDDTELLSEDVTSEPFEPSPFMPAVTEAFENDFNMMTSRQERGQTETDAVVGLPGEKENSTRENNVAKIKVVVRKRPLNKKEIARKEEDIVTVYDNAYLMVHEPKLKVDLTAYVEKHEFCFDAVIDERISNDEVYRVTVEPIIPTIFQQTKATCLAYGQTLGRQADSGEEDAEAVPEHGTDCDFDVKYGSAERVSGFMVWFGWPVGYGDGESHPEALVFKGWVERRGEVPIGIKSLDGGGKRLQSDKVEGSARRNLEMMPFALPIVRQ